MNQPASSLSVLLSSLFSPRLRFKNLLLRLQYTIAATTTISSTRRTTANGANNTGQRMAEAIGLVVVLVEGEGIALPGRLAEAAEGTGVILMKVT